MVDILRTRAATTTTTTTTTTATTDTPHTHVSHIIAWCDTYHTSDVPFWVRESSPITHECARVAVWRGLYACHERYSNMTAQRATQMSTATQLLPELVHIITSYDAPYDDQQAYLAAWHVLQHDIIHYVQLQMDMRMLHEEETRHTARNEKRCCITS